MIFLTKVWFAVSGISIIWELIRNTYSQAPPCNLTRSLSDSFHVGALGSLIPHENFMVVSLLHQLWDSHSIIPQTED